MEDKFIVYPTKNDKNKDIISARVPKNLLNQLDSLCKETGRSRNELIVMCLEFALNRLEIKEEE